MTASVSSRPPKAGNGRDGKASDRLDRLEALMSAIAPKVESLEVGLRQLSEEVAEILKEQRRTAKNIDAVHVSLKHIGQHVALLVQELHGEHTTPTIKAKKKVAR